jgi:type I restriction enzyme S subunit
MGKWPLKPLGDLCSVEGGQAAPQGDKYFENGTIPFVRMKDLGKYHFTDNLIEVEDKVSESTISELNLNVFQPGCILFPRSGSVALNHRGILGVKACIVSHIGVLNGFSPEINNRYLFRFLQNFDMTSLSKRTTGVDSIAFQDVKKILIPVPPLSDQRRIVSILDKADELRRLREKADKRTEDLIPALFYEMFGYPGELSRIPFPMKEIGEIADVTYGFADKLDNTLGAIEGTRRILTISNVKQDGNLDLSVSRYTKAKNIDKEKALLKKHDLLFNWRNGSESHIGKTAIWEEQINGEVLHVSFLLKIRVKQEIVNPFYLWVLLNLMRETGFFQRNSRMQINNKYNASELSDLKIPIPPITLQTEFATRVSSLRSLESLQSRSREKTDALFQSLLHQAFKGEL